MRRPKFGLFYSIGQDLARIEDRNEYVPLGLLYIASMIKSFNFFDIEIVEISKIPSLKKFEYFDFQGISITSSAVNSLILKKISSLPKPKYLRIIGGFHTTLYPEDSLEKYEADIAIVGEGETALKNLIQNFINGDDWRKTPNLVFKLDDNTIIKNEVQSHSDFDDILPPAWDLIDKSIILSSNRFPKYSSYMTVSMTTSRGCPYNCYFCSNQNKKVSYLPKSMLELEINFLKKALPEVKGIVFSDETATFNYNHLKNMCDVLGKSGLIWSIQTRIDTINEKKLQLIKDSGCVEVKFGVESGSQYILDKMDKKVKVTEIERIIKITHLLGLDTKLLLIFGLPGENLDTLKETKDFIERNKDYINRLTIFNFCPLPGSYIYNNPKTFSLREEKLLEWDNIAIHRDFQWWWGEESEYLELKSVEKEYKEHIYKILKKKRIKTKEKFLKNFGVI